MKSRGMTPDEVLAVDIADGHRCAWCTVLGRPTAGAERHHRLPRSRARNLHDHHNVVLLCTAHHHEAHATSRWPWSVPGSTVRGVYIGADPLYDAVYAPEHAPVAMPTPSVLLEEFPGTTQREAEWAFRRALAFRALDLTPAPRA